MESIRIFNKLFISFFKKNQCFVLRNMKSIRLKNHFLSNRLTMLSFNVYFFRFYRIKM